MIDQTLEKFVESLAAKTPTPGGGAASALAGCMGCSLFLMVLRFSRGKKANVAREADLARVETVLSDHLKRLMPMADRDCRSFDLVSAAYGMPKDNEQQQALREKAVQEAMLGAMVVPEELLCMVRDVFNAMSGVVNCIGKAIISDLASGAMLLLASAEGAYLNIRINAAYLKNRDLADSAMRRATAVLEETRSAQKSIAMAVDKMLS
ncbi:MAG TPA: cyclodeaminase/cyclohydrolase family protein [Planctomycetota bacterium]